MTAVETTPEPAAHERRLPFDLRTRDYVKVNGRDYRRPLLDAAWALAEFPAG
jgi:hypothetical protein